ncbi:MAG: hypothetical protein BWY28_02717 [bacterium ADurb.Bin236]|nr:MAG: hypothetical protein BWY28_02717 [bacterium ADurb.Bin236]
MSLNPDEMAYLVFPQSGEESRQTQMLQVAFGLDPQKRVSQKIHDTSSNPYLLY